MAAMVRPSLILKMDFDERAYNDEVKSEIKRSYSYVAPSLVETHEACDGRPENVMRFTIKVHRPYWDMNDEASQELWEGSMVKWLHNMLAKVSNTMMAANTQHKNRGERTVDYAWLDLEFGNNLTIRVKLNADSSIPENTYDIVAAVREAACAGALGDNPVMVSVPSYESWSAQLAAVEAELAAQAEAEAAAAAEAAAQEAEALGDDQAAETDEIVETGELAESADDVEGADDAETADDELEGEEADEIEELPEFPPFPDFEVDYRTWGVEDADGAIREFDSVEGSFVA